MMVPKPKRVRLIGKPLNQLNKAIHERDDYTCIIQGCGRHVSLEEKWHHEPCGSNKQDRLEYGCLLCSEHHGERHQGEGKTIKLHCEEYLASLYPDYWQQH